MKYFIKEGEKDSFRDAQDQLPIKELERKRNKRLVGAGMFGGFGVVASEQAIRTNKKIKKILKSKPTIKFVAQAPKSSYGIPSKMIVIPIQRLKGATKITGGLGAAGLVGGAYLTGKAIQKQKEIDALKKSVT